MSFRNTDYDGATFDSEHGYTEAREIAELLAQEEEEERAREREFRETMFCERTCYDTLAHTARCQGLNEPPVAAALAGWVKAMTVTRRAA